MLIRLWLPMYLENELYNFCVHKSMDRLSINMCYEISLSQSSLMSRSPILHVLQSHMLEHSKPQIGAWRIIESAILTQTMWCTV